MKLKQEASFNINSIFLYLNNIASDKLMKHETELVTYIR